MFDLTEVEEMLAGKTFTWAEGWEREGIKKGRLEGHLAFLRWLLEASFAPLPGWVEKRLARASEEELTQLGKNVFGSAARELEIALHSAEARWRRMGLEKGRGLGKKMLFRRLLRHRFGPLPDWVATKLDCATEEQLMRWGMAFLTATTIDRVFDRSGSGRRSESGRSRKERSSPGKIRAGSSAMSH